MKETHSDESNHSSLCDTRSSLMSTFKNSKKNMILGSLSEQHCIFSLQDRFSMHFIFSGFQQQLICAGSHFGQDRFTLWEHSPIFYHSIKNQYQKHLIFQFYFITLYIMYNIIWYFSWSPVSDPARGRWTLVCGKEAWGKVRGSCRDCDGDHVCGDGDVVWWWWWWWWSR